ncbi:MAG: hypothetical protein V1859_02060 [archaeon]
MAIRRGEVLADIAGSDEVISALKAIDIYFKDKYSLSAKQVLEALGEDSPTIPLSAFDNDKLSSLEIISKYLKENKNKTYHEIASLLNRDDRTIWCTINNANKKQKEKIIPKKSKIIIPLSIFKERKTSVLESIVSYLRETNGLGFNEIANALKKDYQTIWTTYRNARAKNGR